MWAENQSHLTSNTDTPSLMQHFFRFEVTFQGDVNVNVAYFSSGEPPAGSRPADVSGGCPGVFTEELLFSLGRGRDDTRVRALTVDEPGDGCEYAVTLSVYGWGDLLQATSCGGASPACPTSEGTLTVLEIDTSAIVFPNP